MSAPRFVPQMTLAGFDHLFPNEEACWTYLSTRRWPDGVRCPRCNNDHVYESKARPWHWQCMKCGPKPRSPYRFSLKTKTIFEETKKPLLQWFKVLHLMLTSKKGISALQVHRMLGYGSYKTSWYMCMRLRASLHDPDFHQYMGIVEIDETFVGGKEKNKHLTAQPADAEAAQALADKLNRLGVAAAFTGQQRPKFTGVGSLDEKCRLSITIGPKE